MVYGDGGRTKENADMKKISILISTITILFSLSSTSQARRCSLFDKYLVKEEYNKSQIIEECGQPHRQENVGGNVTYGQYRIVEEWHYFTGGINFEQILIIRFDSNGIARNIDTIVKNPKAGN
jgi:outer membrane protein assembly factor BamE (lipoprotein component of BamABCDE complex)